MPRSRETSSRGRKTSSKTKSEKTDLIEPKKSKKQDVSKMLPHELLLAISRGQVINGHRPTFQERLHAAKAAAPFYAPKLQSTTMKGSEDEPVVTHAKVSFVE